MHLLTVILGTMTKLTSYTLEEMEQLAKEGVGEIIVGANKLAIAVHKIYTEQLYLSVLDENGMPAYPEQKDYEPVLLDKLGISRATLYNHYTPIKIACGPTFGLTYDEFIETGGKQMWKAVQPHLTYDTNTGQVKGTKVPIELPEGQDIKTFILEQVKELAPTGDPTKVDLTPGDINKELTSRLSNKQEIVFYLEEREGGGYRTNYVLNQNFRGSMDDSIIPEPVLDEYCRLLKIRRYDNA